MELYGCHPDCNPGRWEDSGELSQAEAEQLQEERSRDFRARARHRLAQISREICTLEQERDKLLEILGPDAQTEGDSQDSSPQAATSQ